eukprot:scaffold306732_cov16-Prasinocladus_malaysianus.AAC.1
MIDATIERLLMQMIFSETSRHWPFLSVHSLPASIICTAINSYATVLPHLTTMHVLNGLCVQHRIRCRRCGILWDGQPPGPAGHPEANMPGR